MGARLPTTNGDERDAVTRWPAKWLDRPHVRARIKRGMRRRERRAEQAAIDAEMVAAADTHGYDDVVDDDWVWAALDPQPVESVPRLCVSLAEATR